MKKLQELYQKRATFLEFGSEVPEALAAQIAEAEKEVLQMELLPIIEDSALKTLPPYGIDGEVLIALEYDNCSLKRIAISSNVAKINDFDIVKDISDDDDDDDDGDDDDGDDDPKIHRSKSIGFSVHFADGKVVKEKSAQRTMIEALRYMGLERASHFNETFKGYPLVGKKQRISDDGYKWQWFVDGWWVYTNLSNIRKIKCIKGIGKMLNIPLNVVLEDESNTVAIDKPVKQKGRRPMYSLNGGVAFCKNRSVLNTVRQFLAQMSSATFKDVCDFFPSGLQGSYGVVRSLDEIERRKRQNRTEEDRWFLEPDEILTAADGVRFAVSNEWGDNFASFQKHVAEQLGWTLEEVE
ncbi:MAG: hypothetical protein PUD39_08240 [Bacteroidales bacterium]|nr:hypothetical protein [Bacteroidales bacterium]